MNRMMKIKKNTKIILAICLCAMVGFSAVMSYTSESDAAKYQNLEMTMFNVGAGDCFYLEMPDGKDILIDGGISSRGAGVVSQLLKKEKNMTLDAVISTHPDADHCGGLAAVFERMKVRHFYYPADEKYSTNTAQNVIRLAKNEPGCRMHYGNPGIKISGGAGSYIKFIQNRINYSSSNQDSIMVYIKYKKFDALISGDAEKGAEYNGIKRINMDIIEAPHHGSKYSSSMNYIKKFDPEKVFISTDGHKYGHPNKETLKRYAAYDKKIKIYRTDKLGTVTAKTNGKKIILSKSGIAAKKYYTKSSKSKTSKTKTVKSSGKVYITATGKKYHCRRNCGGLSNAKKLYITTLSKAKASGLTPCKICY